MKAKPVTALLVVRTPKVVQESYESASGDARERARYLRSLGFKVWVSAMGSQVTPVGRVNLSLVTINHEGREVPAPDKIERWERGA